MSPIIVMKLDIIDYNNLCCCCYSLRTENTLHSLLPKILWTTYRENATVTCMEIILRFRQFRKSIIDQWNYTPMKKVGFFDFSFNLLYLYFMRIVYNIQIPSPFSDPINIFNSDQKKNGFEPLRLSYQRGSHYNAILNPIKATVGLGLGLAGYRITDVAPNVKFMQDAVRMSEDLAIEQTMFEDKLKTTDWEATNEAIEEQIARESYIQWCRDNRNSQNRHPHSQVIATSHHYNIESNSTITSTAKESNCMAAASSLKTQQRASPNRSDGSTESNDMFSEEFDSTKSEISDEASSSKFHNYKYYSQRKRRSNRRPITSTKMSNDTVNMHHTEESVGFSGAAKKRKDSAGTSNNAVQNDNHLSIPPTSDFYHSLLASSYSDSLNG